MNNRLISGFGLCFSLLLAGSAAWSQRTGTDQDLPNFHQVNQQLYRGAQPKSGGLKHLAQLGIRTILSLRQGTAQAHIEETEAHAAGLRYLNIPLSEWVRPADEQVEQVLTVLNNTEMQQVFVHCRLGAERTGLVVAIYRMTHDGWTTERARAEAKQYGMHPWELAMKHYLRDYQK